MSREIRAGGAFLEIYLKGKEKALAQLKGFQSSLKGFATGVGMAGGALTALSGTVLGGLGAAFASFLAQGDRLTDTANRIGITTTRLQELTYAASQSGAEIADVERAMLIAQRKGLDFEKVAAAIGEIEDPMKRNQAAFAAFGKSGARIAPMLADLAEQSAKAHRLGIVQRPEDVAMAGKLADMWTDMRKQADALAAKIGAALAPAMERIFQITERVLKGSIDFIDQNRGLIVAVTASAIALGFMGGAFLGVAAAAWVANTAITAYTIIAGIAAAITAAMAGPFVVVGALLAVLGAELLAAAAYWAFYTESGKRAMSFLQDVVGTTLGGIANMLMLGSLAGAWEFALQGIMTVFLRWRQGMIANWQSLQTAIVLGALNMAAEIDAALPEALRVPGLKNNIDNAVRGRVAEEGRANLNAKELADFEKKKLGILAQAARAAVAAAFPELKQPKFGGGAGMGGVGSQSGQMGAFNAAIAGMAGRTGQLTVEQKQLEVLEEVKDELAAIHKLADEGGLVFA